MKEKNIFEIVVIAAVLVTLGLYFYTSHNKYGKIIDNGDFETGNLDGWETWGYWNYCSPYIPCTVDWCNLKDNHTPIAWENRRPNNPETGCAITGLGISITNDTMDGIPLFGEFAVGIGHLTRWHYVETESKIDLRKNISIPEYGYTMLTFYMKSHGYNFRHTLFQYFLIAKDGDKENYIWERLDTRNDSVNWTFYNLSLDKFKGKNITLIFRVQNVYLGASVMDTSMMFLDNITIIVNDTNPVYAQYNQTLDVQCSRDADCKLIAVPKVLGCNPCSECKEYYAENDADVMVVNANWQPLCFINKTEPCQECDDKIIQNAENKKIIVPLCIDHKCRKVTI